MKSETKFDETVAFAEVEKFLDTPVKHYSSGMYVRLAFAVAAHLEPEILIIDEVLAVGDQQFQQKCLGKMDEVSRQQGRTVLFVSHNLTAVQTLCSKVIYLKSGQLAGMGPVDAQIDRYLKDAQAGDGAEEKGPVKIGPQLVLNRFTFHPNPVASGQATTHPGIGIHHEGSLNEMALLIYSSLGARIAVLDLRAHGISNLSVNPSSPLVLRGTIHSVPLVEGDYQVGFYLNTDGVTDNFLDLACLQVIAATDRAHVPYPAMHRGQVELDFSLAGNSANQATSP